MASAKGSNKVFAKFQKATTAKARGIAGRSGKVAGKGSSGGGGRNGGVGGGEGK